jgi:hypothetical protein
MAKKKRATKRSTRKRRRSTKQGKGAFAPDAFQRTGFQSEAVRSTAGETEPPKGPTIEPPPASPELSTTPPEVRAPIQVAPTIYPDSPHGTVIVNNHITINIRTDEFIQFNTDFDLLIRELRYSNEISGEVRDHLLSELKAGKEIITGPKPQRDLVDLFLVRPLKWLAEKSGSAVVSKLATDALTWLLKIIV